MTPEEIEKIKIKHSKIFSEYKRTGRISECFYHDKSKCNENIKQSHSIQRNGRLSIIEGIVNSNKVIYTFTEIEPGINPTIKSLKPIGKSAASTFFGFCDFHDTTLFSSIENHPFDNSDKHCFLHSYRAFAHSYHRKKEELKSYNSDSNFTNKIDPEWLKYMILGAEISVNEGEEEKKKLDILIENELYDHLEYFTYIIPKKYPIACSSIINPYFSFKGTAMDNHINPTVKFSHIMLTVLPDHNQTIIIFACFHDDEKAILFFDELNDLKDYHLEKAISSIIISCSENTFFAPALWDKLGEEGQRQLCYELEEDFISIPKSFKHSKINFFEPKFSAEKLGII